MGAAKWGVVGMIVQWDDSRALSAWPRLPRQQQGALQVSASPGVKLPGQAVTPGHVTTVAHSFAGTLCSPSQAKAV